MAITAAWDESKHPRNDPSGGDGTESPSDGGKFKSDKTGPSDETPEKDVAKGDRSAMPWKETLSRLDEFTRDDVEAGKVPGIIQGDLREGVAAHARDVDITLGDGAYLENGKLDTVLIAHEAGHYVANEIQREAGKMNIDELAAFADDPGYEVVKDLGNGRLKVMKDGAEQVIYGRPPSYENPWGLNPDPGEILADTYSELLHAEPYEDASDEFAEPRQALLDRVAETAEKMGLPYKRVYRARADGSVKASAGPPMSPEEFTRAVQAGTRIAEAAITGELADAYAVALRSVAGDVARRFTREATSLTAGVWDPAKHPRLPAGNSHGGEWAPTKVGSALLERLTRTSPEGVKALWADDPQDAVATELDLTNAPSLPTIENAKRAAYLRTQESLARKYPEGTITLYRGGPPATDSRNNVVSWSTNRSTARFFARGDETLIREKTVQIGEVLVSLDAILKGDYAEEEMLTAAIGDERAEEIPDPKFVAPDPMQLVPKAKLAAEIEKRTRQIREQVVAVTVRGVLAQAGISFDVGGIFDQRIMDKVGARVRDAELSTRDAIRTVIGQAQDEGWSVPQTAVEIKAHIRDVSDATATQLARTDLIGTSNASAIAAARMIFAGENVSKRWLSTPDERTRPTHVEANGQVVPLDADFTVGDSRLDYPGDPDGPDQEIIQCRCTLLFEEETSIVASVWGSIVAAFDPSLHPRHPSGDERGGEWAPKDAASLGEMESLWNIQKMELSRLEDASPLWTEEGGLGARAKIEVAKDLAWAMENDPDWDAIVPLILEDEWSSTVPGSKNERAAATLIHSWATTSGDSDARALAMQEAARAEFGLESTSEYTEHSLAEVAAVGGPTSRAARWASPDVQPGLQKFLRAQYDLTQTLLKAQGIDQIQLYRGMKFGDYADVANPFPLGRSVSPITSNPLSSWSHDYRVADQFGGTGAMPGSSKAVVAMTVPASRVLSTPFTGFGSLSENETVVLGGDDDAFVWSSNSESRGGAFSKDAYDAAWQRSTYGLAGVPAEKLIELQREARDAG